MAIPFLGITRADRHGWSEIGDQKERIDKGKKQGSAEGWRSNSSGFRHDRGGLSPRFDSIQLGDSDRHEPVGLARMNSCFYGGGRGWGQSGPHPLIRKPAILPSAPVQIFETVSVSPVNPAAGPEKISAGREK